MSQGNITESPMASGGGLKDLISRCLVFVAVPFWKVSPWLLMAMRICKKGRWARRSPYRVQWSNAGGSGYQGTSGYWKFVSPKSLKEGTGSVSISGGARETSWGSKISRLFQMT